MLLTLLLQPATDLRLYWVVVPTASADYTNDDTGAALIREGKTDTGTAALASDSEPAPNVTSDVVELTPPTNLDSGTTYRLAWTIYNPDTGEYGGGTSTKVVISDEFTTASVGQALLSVGYAVREAGAAATLGVGYGVRAGAAATLGVGYGVRAGAAATLSVGYAVDAALGAGSATLTLGYAVRAAGLASLAAGYAVRSASAATVATGWAVRASGDAALSVGYAVDAALGAGSATLATGWAVAATGSATLGTSYAVRAASSTTVGVGWAVRSAGFDALPTGYAINAGGSAVLAAGYGVAAAGTATLRLGYAVEYGSGGGDPELVWEGFALEAGLTPGALLRIVVAAVAGRTEGIGTDTERYFSVDGSKPRITATFDPNGNRTTIVLDGTP